MLAGLLFAAVAVNNWLATVSPLLSTAEKKTYLSLDESARAKFEENFWTEKSISAEDYYSRLQYVDATYGSTKIASGANTDPGATYLSLGPPSRVTHIPSSRIFVPLEIWYYDSVPGINLSTELRLVFYQKNAQGLQKLYSPTLDTIRALLLPQAGSLGIFGPNSQITEADIRTKLTVGPAEEEVIAASVAVAAGIKSTGNDEILGQITSPALLLGKPGRSQVRSRLITARPPLEIVQTPGHFGSRQVDLILDTHAGRQIDVQILDGPLTLQQNKLTLHFSKGEAVEYSQRLDLLPGLYTVIFTIDGEAVPYALNIPQQMEMGRILRDGNLFTVALPQPGTVTWIVRQGLQVISKTAVAGDESAAFESPQKLPPGAYTLEAQADGVSRITEFSLPPKKETQPTRISFNGDLKPALRLAAIARQWSLRGSFVQARKCIQASLEAGPTREGSLESARLQALSGEWDSSRTLIRSLLAANPNDFEALSIFAYLETKLQDYAVAAQLYKRALALQDSPALRFALAKLPTAR